MTHDIPILPADPPSERPTAEEIEGWAYREADRAYALEKERGNDRQTAPIGKPT